VELEPFVKDSVSFVNASLLVSRQTLDSKFPLTQREFGGLARERSAAGPLTMNAAGRGCLGYASMSNQSLGIPGPAISSKRENTPSMEMAQTGEYFRE
jgi:hypothetical protein